MILDSLIREKELEKEIYSLRLEMYNKNAQIELLKKVVDAKSKQISGLKEELENCEIAFANRWDYAEE